jgi:hypothetical protein
MRGCEMRDYRGRPIPSDVTGKVADRIEGWNVGYRAAFDYATLYGHLRVNPDTTFADVNVGEWIRNRRAEYAKGMIDVEVQKVVETIPHWSWQPQRDRWQERFELLDSAYASLGERALRDHTVFQGVNIGAWVRSQRRSYRTGNMAPVDIEAFEAKPYWSWTPKPSKFRNRRKVIVAPS